MVDNSAADRIAEELLEITGTALLSGDLNKFRSCFDFPLRLETVDGIRIVKTAEEFRTVFEDVRKHLKESKVVDFVRTVVSATFVDPDTIHSIHVCNDIHEGGLLERSAYPVRSVLNRHGDRWKISACLYIILDSPTHNAALVNTTSVELEDQRLM